eukprot:2592582-Amphidinium_carterae.1
MLSKRFDMRVPRQYMSNMTPPNCMKQKAVKLSELHLILHHRSPKVKQSPSVDPSCSWFEGYSIKNGRKLSSYYILSNMK